MKQQLYFTILDYNKIYLLRSLEILKIYYVVEYLWPTQQSDFRPRKLYVVICMKGIYKHSPKEVHNVLIPQKMFKYI